MSRNTKIGIVTAAGYLESEKYYERLHGLLEAVQASTLLTTEQKHNLVVMGKLLLRYPIVEHVVLSSHRRRSKLPF